MSSPPPPTMSPRVARCIWCLGAGPAATPAGRWDVMGHPPGAGTGPRNLTWHGWVDEVWPRRSDAGVVATHAGQNAVAEVAAARRPAIVLPQNRPHGEQHATG